MVEQNIIEVNALSNFEIKVPTLNYRVQNSRILHKTFPVDRVVETKKVTLIGFIEIPMKLPHLKV